MNSRLLIPLAIIVTLAAVGIWIINLNREPSQDVNQDQFQTGDTDESLEKPLPLEIKDNFALKFTPSEITVENGAVAEINVDLDGDTFEITSTELVIYYDPTVINVTDIQQGNLFDLYTESSIDSEAGIIRVAGSFTEEKSLTTGTFVTINIQRILPGDTSLQIANSAEISTKVIDSNLGEYSIREAEIIIN